jgi:hypothetical protein
MSEQDKEILYGFFSQLAVDSGCGSCEYETPDGKLVKVTCVGSKRDDPDYAWPDKVFVGEVTKFVRVVDRGPRLQADYWLRPARFVYGYDERRIDNHK